MKTLFICLFTLSFISAAAQQLMLDAGFGNNGIVTTNLIDSTHDYLNATTMQADGKIILAGQSWINGGNVVVMRFNPNGVLDGSFGDGGKFSVEWSTTLVMNSVKVQADGKIVLSGYEENDLEIAMVRLNPGGSIDSSFGTNGLAQFVYPGACFGYDLLILANGQFLITGFCSSGGIFASIMRANSNGTVDSSFGINGFTRYNLPGFRFEAFALQSTGKIVAVGMSNADTSFFCARFDSSGEIDSSFGTNGAVNANIIQADYILSVVIQPDDKVLICGYGLSGSNTVLEMVRLNENGTMDTTFGTSGVVSYNLIANATYEIVCNIALQNDGKIIAVGRYIINNLANTFVARFNSNGTIDTSFGVNGYTILQSNPEYSYTREYDICVEITNDSNIIVSWSNLDTSIYGKINWNRNFQVAKLNSSGLVDSAFGINGFANEGINNADDKLTKILIQNDGKIILCGHSTAIEINATLARYSDSGILDTTFGNNDGIDTVNLSNYQNDYLIDLGGGIVLGSYLYQDTSVRIVHLHNNGSIDTSFGENGYFTFKPNMRIGYIQIGEQSNGNILAACVTYFGQLKQLRIIRITTAGQIDSSFAINGVFNIVDSSMSISSLKLRVDHANNIIAAYNAANGLKILKLNPNGSIDSTFLFSNPFNFGSSSYSLKIHIDGRISGLVYHPFDSLILFRIMSNGSFDSNFASNGFSYIATNATYFDFEIMPDNSYLIEGASYTGDFSLVKIQENGSIDSSWQNNGSASLLISEFYNQAINIFKVLPDQSILIGSTLQKGWPIENDDFIVAKIITGLNVEINKTTSKEKSDLLIHHHPVVEHQLNFSYELPQPALVTYFISDLTGRVIQREVINESAGKKFKQLKLTGNLQQGSYVLSVDSKNYYQSAKFIILENK